MSQGPFLLIVAHAGETETHAFHQPVVSIGRSRECDLLLADRLISRIHCRVERQEGVFVLADAGAQNPAKLRGRPVMRAELMLERVLLCCSGNCTALRHLLPRLRL